ncbi:Dynamin family [Seminavis robusta]|uniref:Dynamin family n=1 Tax=Seminavis robusta TaxID=568900 RepID=A0A9N8ER24_9STRA|nr:Dynamin family [Seminavis robusta]|eukprot:Sro1451_g273840.1 Dynamin family (704) ;mRNA; f:3466-5679
MLRVPVASFATVSGRSLIPKGYPKLHSRWIRQIRSLSTVAPESTEPVSAAPTTEETKSSGGLLSLLTSEERDLLSQQRALMQQARDLTKAVGSVSVKDYTAALFLDNLVDETTFSIVVAGEFNAGKSTLINALLGRKILESGALPTTDSITIITQQKLEESSSDGHEAELSEQSEEADANDISVTQQKFHVAGNDGATTTTGSGVIVHQVANVPLLEDLTLIDTPGTNAVLADHTARTLRLLPTADLILFVTSADRPFPESEKVLLASIQKYRKSIVVILNKMDILDTSGGSFGKEEKQKVVDFVTDHAADLLGGRPMVIPVSSRDALSSKVMNTTTATNIPSNNVWERSNFGSLESFLRDSLTMETKIKTKLTNPIGQMEGMVTASLESVRTEQEELELDVATIKLLHGQYAAWKKEMDMQMLGFRKDVATLLQTEGNRCSVLLNRMGLFKFFQSALFGGNDTASFKAEFDNTRPHVSSRSKSLEAELLESVEETAESIATRGRAQGQAVIEYLGKRPAMKNQSLVGSVSAASRFEDTRKILSDKLSDAVITHVASSQDDEAYVEKRLFRSLQQTAMVSAGLEVGALMSGLATAAELVDIMAGMGSCSLLAIGGGIVYGQGRRRIQNEYRGSWKEKEELLDEALEVICAKELSRVERRILDGVAPYTRFVETEQERLEKLSEHGENILVQAHSLRNRISKLR